MVRAGLLAMGGEWVGCEVCKFQFFFPDCIFVLLLSRYKEYLQGFHPELRAFVHPKPAQEKNRSGNSRDKSPEVNILLQILLLKGQFVLKHQLLSL